jgi:hypothetical protein
VLSLASSGREAYAILGIFLNFFNLANVKSCVVVPLPKILSVSLIKISFFNSISLLASLMVGGLALAPGSATGTTVNTLDLPDLVKKADLIFDGTVTGVQSYLSSPAGETAIHTRVTFILNGPPIKGQASSPLALTFLGGTLGTKHMGVKGMPQFVGGQRLIVFSHSPDDPYVSPIIGFAQGVLRVIPNTETGSECVYRWWGQPVNDSQPFTSRLFAGTSSGAATPGTAETVDQFIQRIKQFLNQ